MLDSRLHIGFAIAAALMAAYLFALWRYAARPPFRIAGYYAPSAFASPDRPWSWLSMRRSTLEKLHLATDYHGEPFSITSGRRSRQHNEAVGGAHESSHLRGYAVDIDINPPSEASVFEALQAAGFRRFGHYSGHIHADDDPKKPENTWYA
jgi:hypothetical protein